MGSKLEAGSPQQAMEKAKGMNISEVQAVFIAERGGIMTIFTSSTVFG